MHIKTYYPSI